MSRDLFAEWTKRHLVQIVIAACTAAVAFGAARAELSYKADKIEVEQLRAEVSRKAPRDSVMDVLRRVDDRTKRIERFICRRNPNDLGC